MKVTAKLIKDFKKACARVQSCRVRMDNKNWWKTSDDEVFSFKALDYAVLHEYELVIREKFKVD